MAPKVYTVLGICGSLRAKSFNMLALRAAAEVMPSNLQLQIADITAIPHFNQDVYDVGYPAGVLEFRQFIRNADALLFACPEYNFTLTGVLKDAIDWASRKTPDMPLANKPAAIFSASAGLLGGARVQYDLRRILSGLHVNVLVQPEVFIGFARTKFNERGELIDEMTSQFLSEQMSAFAIWIERWHRFHGNVWSQI